MTQQGKKWVTPEREKTVIELYKQYESVIKVAHIVGCGRTTVTNILVKNSIPRTGKHRARPRKQRQERELKVKKSHCHTKYCPALVVMLNKCMGYKAKRISEISGYRINDVQNILSKRGLVEKKKHVSKDDVDLESIKQEYLDGATTYELGAKYGVDRRTISKWMIGLGIRLGKGAHQNGRAGRSGSDFVYSERMKELNRQKHDEGEIRFAKLVQENFNGRFEYVSDFRKDGRLIAKIRCTRCGHEFMHGTTDIGRKNWQCPECEKEKARQREISRRESRRLEIVLNDFREYALDKTCCQCGETYHSSFKGSKYCSVTCKNNAKKTAGNGYRHYYHVKYGEGYRGYYDPSITLKKLYERDGGICQICGEPCDWNDKEWGMHGPRYPSIDHIIPRSNGGAHHWDNVQLAHCVCNSYKRELPDNIAKQNAVSYGHIA